MTKAPLTFEFDEDDEAAYADFEELSRGSLKSIPDDCPDKEAARLLCNRMSDISENHYCAGWLVGLEYELFSAAFEGTTFGMGLDALELRDLYTLSQLCDGWWRWHDNTIDDAYDCGERFVRMSEWIEAYKAHMERNETI